MELGRCVKMFILISQKVVGYDIFRADYKTYIDMNSKLSTKLFELFCSCETY